MIHHVDKLVIMIDKICVYDWQDKWNCLIFIRQLHLKDQRLVKDLSQDQTQEPIHFYNNAKKPDDI